MLAGAARLILLLLLVIGGNAQAGELYLEGPAMQSRAEAAVMVRAAQAEGHRARVVRRYQHGVGWEWVCRVEGFTDRDEASEAARHLARQTGHGVSVYAVSGAEARRVEQDAPPDDEVPQAAPLPGAPTDVLALLQRAARAHGGSEGGLALLETAEAVVFRFRRTRVDGGVVRHTWARRGEDRHLEIHGEGGGAVASRTTVVGGEAWLQVGERVSAQDPDRALELVERLAPGRILAFPLGFARAVEQRRELQLLHLDAPVVIDGAPCHVLSFSGDRVSGAVSLALDAETLLVRRAVFRGDGGEVVREYGDWRELPGGLVLPHRVRTWRDGVQVDEVEVQEVNLRPRLPEGWFQPPEG